MTAETFTADVKAASMFATDRFKGGGVPIDATAEGALNIINTANTVADVLQILSDCVARSHEVGPNTMGLAVSVEV
jgi:hypothetical protein